MSGSATLRSFQGKVQGHYGYLLASLLLIFAIYPFTQERSWVAFLLEVAYIATIFACLLVSLGRHAWRVILVAAVVAEVLAFAARYAGMSVFDTPGRVLRIAILFIVMLAVIRDVLRSKEVSMNTVFAAASVYLLMALCWASIFIVLESLVPGSFRLTHTTGPHAMDPDAQLLYLSLVTLTTVGYGDVVPLSPQARILSALEGLLGQLYVAIIIARLVALEISGRQTRNENDGG